MKVISMSPEARVVGEVVWGLTYRMLSQFLEIYPELELDRLEDPPGGS